MNSKSRACAAAVCALIAACSPLKSSPREEKHQLELTLHGLQTNLDDQRRDLNCFQTELQILDGRIKYYENALANLKQDELESHQSKLEQIQEQMQSLEKKIAGFEQLQSGEIKDLQQLLSHANETTAILSQYKERIVELEQDIRQQNKRFEEIAKLKTQFDNIAKRLGQATAKMHKVRPGDSLEKIAKLYKTSVDRIKKENNLEQDMIVVGQELRIPEA